MATLEVHDGRGRVEFVTISRGKDALIGSDPRCDVVLNDPSVQPFHARLRWKGDRFKVDAYPEARSVGLNGQQVVTASYRVGDEIVIGPAQIFLTSDDPGPAAVDEATRVQPRPAAAVAPAGGAEPMMEFQMDPEPAEPPPAARALRKAKAAEPAPVSAVAEAPARPAKIPWHRRLFRKLNAGDRPPGQEDLAKSPLILGLAVALGTLLLIGYGLWNVFVENRAKQQFALANRAFDDFDYPGSIALFDTYLEINPKHRDAGRARVLRSLAKVRQFTATGATSWNAAIENAKEMIKEVGKEPYYRERRMDLAAEILKAAEGFADTARRNADAETLAQAESAVALHEQVADAAHKTILGKSKVPEKLDQARAAVTKAQVRRDAIASMIASIKAEKPDEVYAARDALVRRYPDLTGDKEVIDRLSEANELIRKAVSYDESTRPAIIEPEPDPLGPPVTVAFRDVPVGGRPTPPTADGPLVYAQVQGYVYGVDGSNGAPIWHVPVGLAVGFSPMPIGGSKPSVLVFDDRRNELVRLDGRTGTLIWRQALGEPVTSPPLVLGNQVVQVLPASGKVLFLDLPSGEIRGTLSINRPLSGTPATDEAGQFFYITGDRDTVFVVSRDPVECVSVAYLGHPSGSIRCAPARLANFLIVPENRDLWEGRWSVFVLEQQGEQLRYVQSVSVPGWTWQTPVSQGTIVWSLTDRNALTAFAVGPEDSKEPLSVVASSVPDERPSGPAFAHARGDREIWVSSARLGRFDLETELGSLSPTWTIERAGQSVGPIQIAGRLAVFSHQFDEGAGVALWAVDPSSGQLAWKTVLGAPWPLRPSPSKDGQSLSTLTMDGPEVTIDRDLLTRGGFVQMALRRPGYFALPDGLIQTLRLGDLTIMVPAPDADHLLVREGKTDAFRRVDLPAPLGAEPVLWGDDLFVPGLDGRAYLVNPRTGAPEAEPYVPTFDADRPTRWRAPVFLNSDAVVLADESGRVRRLQKLTEPRLRLDVVGEVEDLKSELTSDPASTGDAILVVNDDGRVRALSSRDLSSLGAWNLEAPRALGPLEVGDQVLLFDRGGGVQAFGPDGNRSWAKPLRDSPPIGPPIRVGDDLWILSRDGLLQRRVAADGSEIDRLDLGLLPGGGLTSLGEDVVVEAAPGSIRLLKPESGGTGSTP